MANEITYTQSLTCTNGSFSDSMKATSKTANQNVLGAESGIILVTTGAAALGLTGIASPGWMQIQNLDGTNYFDVGINATSGGFFPLVRLEAGESAQFRVSVGSAPFLKANAASLKAQYLLLND